MVYKGLLQTVLSNNVLYKGYSLEDSEKKSRKYTFTTKVEAGGKIYDRCGEKRYSGANRVPLRYILTKFNLSIRVNSLWQQRIINVGVTLSSLCNSSRPKRSLTSL